MKKKTKIIIISLLAAIVIFLLSYNLIGSINIKNKTTEYLSAKGCSENYIKSIKVKYSLMNKILSYDEWSISVEFAEEPNIFYSFTYKNKSIIFRGVYDSQKEKYEIRLLEDKFDNGELCNSNEKELLFGNSHWQAVDDKGNYIEGNYIKFSNKGQFLYQSRFTFDIYENYEVVSGFGSYEIINSDIYHEVILTSNRSTDYVWKYNLVSCNIIDDELQNCTNGFNYKLRDKEITEVSDRTDTITLKVKESAKVKLGNKEYTIKLKEIREIIPCDELPPRNPKYPMPIVCAEKKGTYDVTLSINNVDFGLDSGYNPSQQMITTTYRTDYAVYYVPEYKENQATFYFEKDPTWEKENRIIIGNYLVYIDDNNKVIDINTFSKEVQTWGKKYAGKELNDIKEMINKGEDLKKDAIQ